MRQGDVSLHSYDPTGKNLTPIDGDVVLALGETSGHQHVLLPLNETTKTWFEPSDKVEGALKLADNATISEQEYIEQLKLAKEQFKFYKDTDGTTALHITVPAVCTHIKIENGLVCPADHHVTIIEPQWKRQHQETQWNPFLKSIEKNLD